MRNRLLLIALLLVSLCCVGFMYKQTRPQWEYMTTSNTTTKKLNELGSQGWEIVGVEPVIHNGTYMSTNVYLKRGR